MPRPWVPRRSSWPCACGQCGLVIESSPRVGPRLYAKGCPNYPAIYRAMCIGKRRGRRWAKGKAT